MNQTIKMLQALGMGNEGQEVGNAAQGLGGANAGQMDEEGIGGIGNMLGVGTPQPNGEGMMPLPEEPPQQEAAPPQPQHGFDIDKIMADNSLKGIVTKMMLHKKAPWLFNKNAQNKEAAYQGSAREALDIQRLKDKFGEGSDVYQQAKAEHESKQQARKDLSLLRDRTNEGLKPGEKWIINPETGEHEGIIHNSTPKEIAQEEGQIMFNEFYPLAVKGGSALSGEGSIKRFEDAASKYGKDQQATKLVDDYLLYLKVLTATEVTEAATLNSGKTNQSYSRIRESIKSDDIQGRSATFDAIVKGEPVSHAGTPASFSVLTNQIRGLALDIEPVDKPMEGNA